MGPIPPGVAKQPAERPSRCTASQHGVLARQDAATATSFVRASIKHQMSPLRLPRSAPCAALQNVVLRAESGRAPATQRALPHRRAVAVPPASFFLQQAARGLLYTAACLEYAAHSHPCGQRRRSLCSFRWPPFGFSGSVAFCFGCFVSVGVFRLVRLGCLLVCLQAAGLAAVRADRQRAPVWFATTEPQRAVEHHTATARIV